MKKIKLLYLLPLAAMVLSGCENPFKKKQNTEPEQQQSGEEGGGGQGGGGQQQSVTLVDFENKADTAELGSTYALPNVATDTAGNDYQVVYRAVNAEGQAVALDRFNFVASTVGVFTITGTVTLEDGSTRSRVITLTVADTVAPTITLGRVKTGYVGVSYKLPQVTTNDVCQDLDVQIKVFLLGEPEQEMQLEDGRFTPTVAGNYQIRVTASDGFNTGREEANFEVKASKDPAAPTEVLDFADEDESCMRKGPRDAAYSFEILDEYEGEDDVMKVTTEDECITVVFNEMAHEKSHYADYDNVVMRMFIPSAKRVHHLMMNSETSSARYYDLDGSESAIKYDQWFDYKFEATCLLAEGAHLPNIFMYTYEHIEGSFYIADISVEKVAKVTIASPANGVTGEEYTLPEITTADFVGDPTVVVKVFLLGENDERTEMTVENGKFTPETAGQYLIEVTASDEAGNTVVKTAEFTVTAYVDNPREDEVIDFDEKSDLNSISFGGRPEGRNEASWLASFEGETGVLKIHTMDDLPKVQLDSMVHSKDYYLDFDVIIFKMWLNHKGNNDYHHIYFATETSPMYYFNGSDAGGIDYEQWVEFTFPTSKLNADEHPGLSLYNENYGDWADFYIADIRVADLPDSERADEVIDFNEAADLSAITYGDRPEDRTDAPELVRKFEGEKGVLKIHTMDDNPRIRITQYAHDLASYAGNDYLVVRMWLEHKGTNDYHHIYLNEEAGDMYYFNGGGAGPITYESWVDYKFGISELRDGGFEIRAYNDNYGAWANIYIADIRVEKAPDLARADEVIDFNEDIDLQAVTYGDRPADRAEDPVLLDSFEGETGVLKVRTMDDNPRIRITSYANEMSAYSSYSYLVVRMYLEHKGSNDYHHIWINNEGGDMYYFNGGGAGPIAYGQWVDYSFDISDLTDGGFEMRLYNENYGQWANIYIADIRVANNRAPIGTRADEVLGFNLDLDVAKVSDGGRPEGRNELSWVETFGGEYGVLKLRTMDDMPRLQLNDFANDKASYAAYDKIVFKMYIDLGEKANINHIWMNAVEGESYRLDGGSLGSFATGEWIELSFPIARLTESSNPQLTFYTETYGSWANIYFADIKVVKNPVERLNEVIGFDKAADLAAVTYGDRPADRAEDPELLDTFEGETGVLKVRTMDDNPRIRITSYARDLADYSSYSYVVVRMWLEHKGTNDYHHIYLNEEAGDMYYFNGTGAGSIYYEQWVDFSFPISELRDGGFEIRAYNDNYGQWANMYIADIRVTNMRPDLQVGPRADEIVDFNEDEDISAITCNQDAATFELLQTFEGENGVLKVNSPGEVIQLRIAQSAHARNEYGDYNRIVLKIFIEKRDDHDCHHVWMNDEGWYGTRNSPEFGSEGNNSLVSGAWVLVDYDLDTFTNTHWETPFMGMYFVTGTASNIYIADIYAYHN